MKATSVMTAGITARGHQSCPPRPNAIGQPEPDHRPQQKERRAPDLADDDGGDGPEHVDQVVSRRCIALCQIAKHMFARERRHEHADSRFDYCWRP